MTILSKAIYRFKATSIKLPVVFLISRTQIFTICVETQKVPDSHLEKEEWSSVRSELPDFIQYYKATVIKIVRYWHKNRNTGQGNKTENTDLNPHTYGHLTFDKEVKNT